ncbi:hypothetical protein CQ046_11685 [Chryseobacterium sp. MYb7]|uniref:hypothetical protein n=1 Tax=Chryseobacterium sp. MYb7 TaxID=1827290 RepID=UPI000CFED8FE|nr:hypothetical protein [Chryseobacterium sp. MYb7]PRB02857.1 hypothetical protein CQ046_11685 [Chryseobacterium sp. MYb7]
MLRKNDEKINGFLFVIVLPLLLFSMSYYGFETSYVLWIKSADKAPDFIFESVYAYRVIPNFLSVHVTEAFTFIVENHLPFLKAFLSKSGSYFYHSTFLINVFFFIWSCIILYKILKMKPVELLLNAKVRRLVHLAAVFFMVIVQYVPTNCDSIAIFFYLWGIFFTLKYFHGRKKINLIALCAVVFVSTFVRETSCLNIAFFAAVFLDWNQLKNKNYLFVKDTIWVISSFCLAYIVLRMAIHQTASFMEGIYIVKNFTSPYNLVGLLFGVLGIYFTYQLSSEESSKHVLKKYLFFSLPYLFMITLVGLFWETRLFLPLILTGVVAASHQFKNFIS